MRAWEIWSVKSDTNFISCQNAACSNEYFLLLVDYALEGCTFWLSKLCDFCRLFHGERSWHAFFCCGYCFWSVWLMIYPLISLGPGSAVEGKRQKTKKIRKISASEASPAVVWGRKERRRGPETCLWCRRSMIPDSGTMLWLVKCLCVLSMSSSYDSGKDFQRRILSKQYKFLCETFRLSLGSKKSKKYACDRLQREKLSIPNIEFFLYFPVINCGHI